MNGQSGYSSWSSVVIAVSLPVVTYEVHGMCVVIAMQLWVLVLGALILAVVSLAVVTCKVHGTCVVIAMQL